LTARLIRSVVSEDTETMAVDIDCAFPGGNIVVERITADEVELHQDLRDTAMDWFYWCFRVRGAARRPLRFTFTRSRAIGVRGPAMSVDGGETWTWLGSDAVDGNSFFCSFPADASEVRLSFAMPYQEAHWQRFMTEVGSHPAGEHAVLCVTPKGRNVECLVLGSKAETPKHRVAITCRHHCCEMMVNYVLEGLIGWVLEDADAEWLRRNVEFFLVPFVDKDGVEDGDQGKGRQPRDHGRDYEGESIYASTRAIRERLPVWGSGRLRIGVDLHCPHISGSHNEEIYLVGFADDRMSAEQERFSEILESVAEGPLPFSAGNFLPFGKSWNTGEIRKSGKGFTRWISEHPNVVLSAPIEVPYANAGGAEVNQTSARLFGMDLGRGLTQYLRTID
jgi:hypothetical protein